MDVISLAGFPAGTISNFTPHEFVFDGVKCSSMEGLIQSFKFQDRREQIEVCKLSGFAAKRRGQTRNDVWQHAQKLWWNNQEYDRHGSAYQILLDRAFETLVQNDSFRDALLATNEEVLTHSVGSSNPNETVLTEQEFCSRLMRMRARL